MKTLSFDEGVAALCSAIQAALARAQQNIHTFEASARALERAARNARTVTPDQLIQHYLALEELRGNHWFR